MTRASLGTNDFRAPRLPTPGYTMVRDITYSGALKVDISKPNTAGRPIVLVLHGGGWDSGDKTDPWYALMAARFADLGFCVGNANYTLTGGAYQTPITNVLTLVSFFRANGATYNGDTSRIVIVGASAGGHLGLMAGITGVAGGSRPDAVVGWSPACDLELAYGQGNGPATLGVGGYMNIALSGNETIYRSISPTRQITAACCSLRIVGSSAEDTSASGPGLNVAQYTGMVAAAQAVGVPVTSRIFTSCQVHALFCSPSLSGADFNGADDVAGTARWIRQTLAPANQPSNRTVAIARVRATGRMVAV